MSKHTEKKRRHDALDAKINQILRIGIQNNQPAFDMALVDCLFRPFVKELDDAQEDQINAGDVQDAIAACMANMIIETALRMVARTDPDGAVQFANKFMVALAEAVTLRTEHNFAEQKPISKSN